MVEKKLYKIVAFFIAILLYILFGTALISYIKESAKIIKDYGFNVDDAIVVELSNEEDKPQKKSSIKEKIIPKPIVVPPTPKVIKSEPIKEEHKVEPIVLPPDPEPEPVIEKKIEIEKPKEEPKKLEEKPQESRDKEEKSAKDLFSTVRTDDYDKVLQERIKEDKARASRLKKQEAQKKAQQRAKRAKAKKEKQKRERIAREAQEMVENFNLSAPTSHKKRGDRHEYWSEVSSKIMSKWNRTISTQDGLNANVRIKIDSKGRLTYKVLSFSNNNLFDTKLKAFLDNLEYERFPRYKGGSSIEATFEFKDKEEG